MRVSIFSFLFFFFSLVSKAQLDRFKQITTSDGLPENTGQCIVQDQLGFIWIGTQNGLARYDGIDFKVYQHQPGNDSSLSNNQVEYLFLDEPGVMWISTRNGLNRFDIHKESFELYLPDTSEAFHQNWFRYGIEKDKQGHIWSSTMYGFYEIIDWDSRNIRFYPNPGKHPTALAYDHAKNQIYGSLGDSIFTFSNGLREFHSRSPYEIQDLYFSSRGLLAGTFSGAYVYHNNEWKAPNWLHVSNTFYTSNFFEDNDGNLWILTSTGLIKCDQNANTTTRTHQVDNPESLGHDLCISMMQDRQGLYWIGTGQGVNILDPRQDQFTRLSIKSGVNFPIPDPHIEAIHFEDAQNLWVGTSKGLLHVEFENAVELCNTRVSDWPVKSYKVYTSETTPNLHSDNIDFISTDGPNLVFIGMESGELYQLNKRSQKWIRWESPNLIGQLRGVVKWDDQYWIGYRESLRLADSSLSQIEIPDWIPQLNVLKLFRYRNELWVGTPVGLYVIDPSARTWRVYPAGEGVGKLPNTMMTHLYGTDSTLWISTFGGGLYRHDPVQNTFRIYTEVDGLPNNNIWAVYPDNSGNLWLSTDNGICRYSPKRKSFTNYKYEDGLNFNDFSLASHTQSKTGEILFGNPEGITVFNPKNISDDPFIAPVSITSVDINYKSRAGLLQKILQGEPIIELLPKDKTLSLQIAVLGFRSADKNRYAFKLEGYDDQWVVRKARDRYITYTDLPAGSYTLLLSSVKGNNDLKGSIAQIPIVVIPPFYQTLWFKITAGLGIILLIGLVMFLINRRRYLQKIRDLKVQQKIHSERERISRDLHDHVGAHLTKIVTDLDILSMKIEQEPREANQEQIDSTRGFTQNTMRLLRDTIWAIDQDEFSIEELAVKTESYLQQYLGDFVRWSVVKHIEGNWVLGPNEVMNILRIIQEATQNMVKYARASYFEVVFKYNTRLEIEISDNGVGFTQSESLNGHYGLKNMKNRADEINAKLEINSIPGQGTVILISLVT